MNAQTNITQALVCWLSAASVILVAGGPANAEWVWTRKADMPMPRWGHSSAVVNGKIYIIGGGMSEPDMALLSTVEEFDPVTQMWTRKADMPTARGWMSRSSAVVNARVYVIGGIGALDRVPTVEAYDPATDTWTPKADMPTPRWNLATCELNGKIYAIGGSPGTGNLAGLVVVEEYDPAADTWTRKADMPLGVWGPCANVVNGKIYAFGGRSGSTAVPYVQEYDPTTDTWTRKADMLVSTSQMASVVLYDRIIVIGGWYRSNGYPYTAVQVYDAATNTWTREPDTPFLRSVLSADPVNNRIYAIGGTDRPHPCLATSTVYELGPVVDFNGDGKIDYADLLALVINCGTNDMLYDVGPMPWGDGVVDIEDLKVFTTEWEKQTPTTDQ